MKVPLGTCAEAENFARGFVKRVGFFAAHRVFTRHRKRNAEIQLAKLRDFAFAARFLSAEVVAWKGDHREAAGSGLDTYLILNNPSGAEEAYNDDGGTGYNSRIQRTLDATGTYTILARGYNGRPGASTGAYELSLEGQ